MEKKFLLVLTAACFLVPPLQAQERGVGVGVVVGDPTGISVKLWTGPSNAVQFALAWKSRDQFLGTRVSFSGDYLWHSFHLIKSEQWFPVYYGVGGVLASGGGVESALGIRGVVGLAWFPRRTPLDVFLQVAPILTLTPSTDIELEAGVGIRYFFE